MHIAFRYTAHSGQVLFVTKMLAYSSDVNKVVNDEGMTQKQHVLDMLNSQVAKMEVLMTTIKESQQRSSEESMAKYSAALGIEIVMRYKVELIARMVFNQDGEVWEHEEIKKRWQEEMLKYGMTKEPFDVYAAIDNR